MSYSIRVDVKDGTAVVTESGTVSPPDGTFIINGHDPVEGTWQADQIKVSRFTGETGNQLVISAESVKVK